MTRVLVAVCACVALVGGLFVGATRAAEASYTGRIIKGGIWYYLMLDGRWIKVNNPEKFPELDKSRDRNIKVLGELTRDNITLSKIEIIEPMAQLKELFPKAGYFSPRGGTTPHYTAYAVDPKTDPSAKPLGYAFFTTDVTKNVQGFDGPIYTLVGMDPNGRLTGVVVDFHTEPYGYFSIETPEYRNQFKGKSIRDAFRVGGDIDAISRASISVGSTTRAIRDSARAIAKELLSPEDLK